VMHLVFVLGDVNKDDFGARIIAPPSVVQPYHYNSMPW
jgi:hypothetical protein